MSKVVGFWAIVVIVAVSSCVPNKKVVYLQDLEQGSVPFDSVFVDDPGEYQLQIGDIINIEVRSSDPTVAEIFRPISGANNAGQLAMNAADINYLTGFTLDKNGQIELPLVGYVSLDGKTLKEAKETIEEEVKKYILDAFVSVRFGGIRYSALGEFNRPGRYSVLQTQLTIFEAIANAGDLTVVANRAEAIIIRQYPEGPRLHRVDLTDRNLVKSPFYYIQPNDQLYVEPLKVREIGGGVGVTGFQTFAQTLSVVSSVLLIIVSVSRL